jgi:DNA-binding NarL/FixJ family response regulator
MHSDVTYAVDALEAGALGYVLKHSAPSELSVAIRSALKGVKYITPLLSSDHINGEKKSSKERKKVRGFLTQRQREVLQLLAEGKSAKQIASLLEISTKTIEYHKYQMMKDLNLKTLAELVRYAVKYKIVSD